MRSFLKATLIWAIVAAVGGFAVVWLGLYNVSARQGHFPGISWVLHTAYRSAVALRAPAEATVPDLSSASLIKLGRGHYEDACAFCHAMPDGRQSQTALSMLPAPPHVTDAVSEWEPRHMFWIVKNGVKMSGMPAWPSDRRDDDVWAVVAYLNAVKTGQVVAADEDRDDAPLQSASSGIAGIFRANCADCHGEDGFADGNVHVPRLDTLPAAYIEATLQAYRSGARHSGIMQQASSQLSDLRIAELAAHVEGLEQGGSRSGELPSYEGQGLDPAVIERGEALAHGGDSRANIPSCIACHGPGEMERSDRFPPLAGQSSVFLVNQLALWKSGRRGGTDRAVLMHKAVPDLTQADMHALAQYYASLPPLRR